MSDEFKTPAARGRMTTIPETPESQLEFVPATPDPAEDARLMKEMEMKRQLLGPPTGGALPTPFEQANSLAANALAVPKPPDRPGRQQGPSEIPPRRDSDTNDPFEEVEMDGGLSNAMPPVGPPDDPNYDNLIAELKQGPPPLPPRPRQNSGPIRRQSVAQSGDPDKLKAFKLGYTEDQLRDATEENNRLKEAYDEFRADQPSFLSRIIANRANKRNTDENWVIFFLFLFMLGTTAAICVYAAKQANDKDKNDNLQRGESAVWFSTTIFLSIMWMYGFTNSGFAGRTGLFFSWIVYTVFALKALVD